MSSQKVSVSICKDKKEDGIYELVDWPRLNDHSCWADGNCALIRKARNKMFEKVSQDPSQSINILTKNQLEEIFIHKKLNAP